MTDRLLRLPAVMERTGISRATIYRLERQQRFPARVKLSGNIVAWRESDLARWIEGGHG